MPTYEYICNNPECKHEFEVFQSMKDNALTVCPKCEQSTIKRKIGLGAGIIFKGNGFYETDYKRKPEASTKSEASKAETSAPAQKSEKAPNSSTTT